MVDQFLKEQKERVNKIFEFKVDDCLEFTPEESTQDEWEEMPEIFVKSIWQLWQHSKTTSEYLKERSKEEVTASLRTYAEARMTVSSKSPYFFLNLKEIWLNVKLQESFGVVEFL